ncbi:hypothetical protein GCM10010387_03470 [Streptomyces inusitatus]|uniref:Uncharacterized protein n=1 Tax=Streptomyces inusitatus TaxID=68221 RepID=A0A918PL19_9ACTN|nr:hypothetical protein [Streptomyces inusitatus]GGZ14632.1 hypothetical protein GCM10010387_03470 [Streptomyces inusitatus]
MSCYRITYAGEGEKVYRQMEPRFRAQFDAAMQTTLAKDPYGHGSAPADPGREPDRRSATIAGPPAFVVTAVKIIHG